MEIFSHFLEKFLANESGLMLPSSKPITRTARQSPLNDVITLCAMDSFTHAHARGSSTARTDFSPRHRPIFPLKNIPRTR
jgi:hypothetical protein